MGSCGSSPPSDTKDKEQNPWNSRGVVLFCWEWFQEVCPLRVHIRGGTGRGPAWIRGGTGNRCERPAAARTAIPTCQTSTKAWAAPAFSNTLDSNSRVRVAESAASKQTYTYDGRDRLTAVQDIADGNCTTRQYGFSLDSNRTSLTTSGPGAGGACTTAGAITSTPDFDAADRITDPGYTYDALGRTRTVPAAHTDQPTSSALAVGYHANDMVAKLAQTVPDGAGGTSARSKSLTLDASDRVSTTTDTTAGVELRSTVNRYVDGDDSPAWIESESRPNVSAGWSTSWSRNVTGPGGDLAIIQPSTGGAKLQVANLHGDIVATIDNGSFGGVSGWAETNEYGLTKNPADALGQDYGWLGTKQRSTDTVGGLTLMGARLYNPTTGRFLSRGSRARWKRQQLRLPLRSR